MRAASRVVVVAASVAVTLALSALEPPCPPPVTGGDERALDRKPIIAKRRAVRR